MLRYTIKTLTDVTIDESFDATVYEGSALLRRRIKKLARTRLGEGAPLVKLQALITRCERATAKRNILTHSFYAKHSDGVVKAQGMDREWKDLPTAEELDFINNEITTLVMEVNHARLKGFLHEALAEKQGQNE